MSYGPVRGVDSLYAPFKVVEDCLLETPGLYLQNFTIRLGRDDLIPGDRIRPVDVLDQQLVIQAPPQDGVYTVRQITKDKNQYFDPKYLKKGIQFVMAGSCNYSES